MGVISSLNKNKVRIITGVIISLIVLFCAIRGGLALLLLILTLVYLCSKEYVEILSNKGFLPFFKVIITVGTLLTILTSVGCFEMLPLVLAGGIITSFLVVLFRGRQPYIANVATTILGFTFAWLPCYIILIRQLNTNDIGFSKWHFNDGMNYLILLFFVILMTDIGAYFFGSKYGKTKLAEVISPKKTVEGAIGGAACAIATSLIIGYLIHIHWYQSLIVGILITIFAQLGDLSESLIKRDAGVKDSGDSLPGHGGFLDRADSYLFSAPVAYYYLKYFVVSHNTMYDYANCIKKVLNVIGF